MMIDAPSYEMPEGEGSGSKDTVQKLTPQNAKALAAYINQKAKEQAP